MQTNLEQFDPEDPVFWEHTGRKVAIRNLVISCVCLALAFVLWFLWSILVLYLPAAGFDLSSSEQFTLVAVPMISGAVLRVAYAFVVPLVGGRNWTVLSTASLLIPVVGIGLVVQDPSTPYSTLLVLAVACGLGGGNFASSMANIQSFFPKRLLGLALGANAGLGNLGVSLLQMVAPLTLGLALYEPITGAPQSWAEDGLVRRIYLQNVAYLWVLPIVGATLWAHFGMNNLKAAQFPLRAQAQAFRSKHLYIITILYTMSFGSFVGFSALFPMVSKMYFPGSGAEKMAFLGPMLGSLIRPLGGWIADRVSGAKVTFWTTIIKTLGALGVIYFLPLESRSYLGFFLTFMLVFLMSGIANASIFKMVPVIFRPAQAGAVMGLSSAIASLGAFVIPQSFSWSLDRHGTVVVALWWIVAFYVFCLGLMWWVYLRRGATTRC